MVTQLLADTDMFSVKLTSPDLKISYFSSQDAAAEFALGAAARPKAFIAMNAEKLMKLKKNPDLFSDIQNSTFYPDGASILWFTSRNPPRIPGVELWLKVLERINASGGSVVVIGAAPEVSQKSAEKLVQDYPHVVFPCIDGFQPIPTYLDLVKERMPDAVFVAMGTPHQEGVIAKLQTSWPNGFYMGIGGSLDILSGKSKRAPRLLIALHVEFLYRLLKEPKRIFRQKKLFGFLICFIFGKFHVK